MTALSIPEFIGHLHPVLVHLPIGFLLLACLFFWQSKKIRFAHLQPAINTILCWGMISAIVACITGFILSRTGDYDESLAGLHQWMGISVAIISILTFYLRRKQKWIKWQAPLTLLLLVLIFITGHLGGSLTHGSDYLTSPLLNLTGEETDTIQKRKPIPDISQAIVYNDVVQPILEKKCYTCHGPNKQKGKLRMDDPLLLMKGGKDGRVIIPGNTSQSELIKRILLPREEEKHMPPKEKTQLNDREIALLQWWITEGADLTKKVKEIKQPEKIQPILLSLQNDTIEKKSFSGIPATTVDKANEQDLQHLKERGVMINPIAQNNNWLSADFVTVTDCRDNDLKLLLPVKNQLLWLKLSNTRITDSAFLIISKLDNITRLQLDHTSISDMGIPALKSLKGLQVLNLVATNVSAKGLLQLSNLPNLQSVYLYQSKINGGEWEQLRKSFPKTILDTGGYTLPFIESDTMLVKPPKQKK